MQFSPWSVFLPLRSKYRPQHSVLKNPQSMFLPQSERPSFAPIQHREVQYIWHKRTDEGTEMGSYLYSQFHICFHNSGRKRIRSLLYALVTWTIIGFQWVNHYQQSSNAGSAATERVFLLSGKHFLCACVFSC
jgi:hypothetical protein